MNIRDIAALAGVSVSTVSKVMNKRDASIRPETRERILQIVKEYNYTPYANVRTPAKGTTLVLGVLLSSQSLHSAQLLGMLRESHRQGYGVLAYVSSNAEEENKNIHVLSSFNVDGILWDAVADVSDKNAQLLSGLDIPCVSLSAGDGGENICHFDFRRIGGLCAERLIQAQHTKIICLTPDESALSLAFADGVQQKLQTAGGSFSDRPFHVVNAGTDLSSLLCNCTAAVCLTARTAEAVVTQAENLGLHIPGDLSVICLNCDADQASCSGRISMMQLPYEQMGRYAAASLIARLEAREENGEAFSLEPKLNHSYSIMPPKSIRGKKIIVVGAINMDILIGLDEALQGGESVTARSRVKMPGGKGLNQAVGAARLGAETYLIGRLGRDYEGSLLYEFLRDQKVNLDGVILDEQSTTGSCYVQVLRDGEASIIGFYGASDRLCGEDIDQKAYLFDGAACCIVQFVALPDPQLVRRTVEIAHEKNVKVILKPCKVQQVEDDILRQVDYFLPNRKEIERLVPGSMSYEKKAQYFLDKGVQHVIITLGHRGCYLRDAQHSMYFPAAKVNVVDTTGAGDAFAATFAYYLTEGRQLEDAIRYATVAAGLSTTRQGVPHALVDKESIECHLAQDGYVK